MIDNKVIQELYRRFKHPAKSVEGLNIPYFENLLKSNNPIKVNDEMIEIQSIEEFSPFKRFLIRRLNKIIEFERNVAFVFNNHILFLSKETDETHIHLKPDKRRRFFGLFGK